MQGIKAIVCVAGLALGGCSINDDLRNFQSTIPAQVSGLAWPALLPLGSFAARGPVEPAFDPRSLAQRAAALRLRAARLKGPVLDPARARAMRAALRRVATP